jgi:hypothetical protein
MAFWVAVKTSVTPSPLKSLRARRSGKKSNVFWTTKLSVPLGEYIH